MSEWEEGRMIREIIVVEGKDDVAAVKAAVDCECVITHGVGFGQALLDRLALLEERRGLIVLTDPDYAGERIRKRIRARVPRARMAYLPRQQAVKGDDIGVENASPEAIREALKKAHASLTVRRQVFGPEDLERYGLTGQAGAKERRILLGKKLGIGYGNSKQLLARLNDYDIPRALFEQTMEEIHDRAGKALHTQGDFSGNGPGGPALS